MRQLRVSRKEKRATKIESITTPMAQKPLGSSFGLAVWSDPFWEQSTTKSSNDLYLSV